MTKRSEDFMNEFIKITTDYSINITQSTAQKINNLIYYGFISRETGALRHVILYFLFVLPVFFL